MKTLVAYYSFGGSTQKVAEHIAQHLSADMEEIKSSKSYESGLGFFKAAYDSWRGHLPAIVPIRRAPEEYDLVVVGAPLWAGHAATPARSYLQNSSGAFKRIALLITHGGSSPDRAFEEMAALAGRASETNVAIRT